MELGLIAKLKRTKTTGPGKANGVLRVFTLKGTCVVDPTSMQKRYELWCSSAADKNRDYFLARATAKCRGFSEKYASAGDLAGMGMRMLMELEVPEKKDNMWCSTGVKMRFRLSASLGTKKGRPCRASWWHWE